MSNNFQILNELNNYQSKMKKKIKKKKKENAHNEELGPAAFRSPDILASSRRP